MKTIKNSVLAIGLISIGCSIGLPRFMFIPDFWQGFLIGFGITMTIAGLLFGRIKLRNNR